MRGSSPGGRFNIPAEIDRYWAGIDEDLQRPAGGSVPWWRWNPGATVVDPIYDEGSNVSGGREWFSPIPVKFIAVHLGQGATLTTDTGFYNADTIRLIINMADMIRSFPGLEDENDDPTTDDLMRDRVEFNGKVFRPVQLAEKGRVLDRYAIMTVDLVEVHSEEMVNDPQFASYANDGD